MSTIIYEACHLNDAFVELTDQEYEDAMNFGSQLYHYSQQKSLTDHRKFKRNGVDGERAQQIGAVAECAGAKVCGLPWLKGVNTFKKPDLPHNVEVRLIGSDRYGLRVYDRDNDSRRVLGIIIEPGKEREPYRVPGWINAKYAKKPDYVMDPLRRGRPMFAVPQNKLKALSNLLELIKEEQKTCSCCSRV